MSAQSQKPFDATPARKQRALREGNAARSSEVPGITAFACGAAATFAVIPSIGAAAAAGVRTLTAHPDLGHVPPTLGAAVAFAFVPAVAAACGGAGASLAQTGGLRVAPPKLDPGKLNPLSGLKRMLGGEALVGAARALCAFAVATAVLWPLGCELFARAATLTAPAAFGMLVTGAAERAFIAAVLVGGAFAAADYALARRRWLTSLKMSHDELKRDLKENDGDPHARSRRSALHRSIVRGSVQNVRDATFVLVNPTHVAIAVRYAPPEVAVPQILVRAAGDVAVAVRTLAAEAGIPIVENVPLARALYAQGEAGRAIPSETFVAVARVIAELIREGIIT